MDKCEHGAKITHFCIYQYCSAKEAAGCENCLKKYHCHVGQGQVIKTEEVDFLTEKFSVQNLVKPKCRQFQQLVFSFFTQIKTEISQTIDIVCKGMVNKIGYPLLSKLNHLSSYKRIKNKEYKKLTPKELRKIYLDCKALELKSVATKQRELYIEEIIQNFATVQSMENLIKQYENLAKKICKNFKHDSSAYKKILDLRNYLNTVLKLDLKQANKNLRDNEENSTDFKEITKQPNTPAKQNSNSISKIHQSQQTFSIKAVAQRNITQSKQKHLRNFSIEKQLKTNEFNHQYQIKTIGINSNSYESNQKEILQRKDKLMKMMSFKEKSVPKTFQDSPKTNNHQSYLILSKQQNMQNQSPHKEKFQTFGQKQEIYSIKLSAQNWLKIETPKKNNQNVEILSISPQIKQCNSVRSFKQEVQQLHNENKNCDFQDEEKYKYGMVRLPSSQSISSDAENFKSQIKSVSKKLNIVQKKGQNLCVLDTGQLKQTKEIISESSSLPINIINPAKIENKIDNQEKSTDLYLMALEQNSFDKRIQYLKAALDYCQKNVSAAEYLSSVYIDQFKAKECLDLCNEYLTLLKKSSNLPFKLHFIINKSASLNMLGRYSESITLLESEILHLQHPKMYKNLGDAYFSVGINEKCQYNYEKAIKINPNFDQAMYNLAVCIFTQGNFFNADIWISKALEIDGKNFQYQTLKREIIKRLANVAEQSQLLN